MTKTVVPFPNVCLDCFHAECIALVEAWALLTEDFKKQESAR